MFTIFRLNSEKEVAIAVKEWFDDKYKPHWSCVVAVGAVGCKFKWVFSLHRTDNATIFAFQPRRGGLHLRARRHRVREELPRAAVEE